MNKTKKSRKDLRKRREMNRRLLNYSLVAGTTLALGTPANAAIRYSGVKNQVIDNSIFQLDMQDVIGGTPDGNPEFSFVNYNTNYSYATTYTTTGGKRFAGAYGYNADVNMMAPVKSGDAFMANTTATYFNPVANLPIWASVGPGATNFVSNTYGLLNKYYKVSFQGVNTKAPYETYAFSYKGNYGDFGGKRGYMGVRFDISGNTHYGWIQFDAAFDGLSGTIVDWAYEDVPGKAVAAGDTGPAPIPTLNQWGMMFLAGLILLEGARRLRKEKVREKAPK